MPSNDKPPPQGSEPIAGESEADSPVFGELTKEEYLEREVWTLQYHFDELVKEDLTLAVDFLRYAAKAVKEAMKKEKASE